MTAAARCGVTPEQAARRRIEQLREIAAEIEPSTVEADASMRAYLDDADLLERLLSELATARQDRTDAEFGRDLARRASKDLERELVVVRRQLAQACTCLGTIRPLDVAEQGEDISLGEAAERWRRRIEEMVK